MRFVSPNFIPILGENPDNWEKEYEVKEYDEF